MKIKTRVMCIVITVLMILSISPISMAADTSNYAESGAHFGTKVADDTTLRVDDAFSVSTKYDGMIWTNKAVSADGNFAGIGLSSNFSTTCLPDEFCIGLSALAQGYSETVVSGKKKANISFVVDLSTSMTKNYMYKDGVRYSRLQILQSVANDFIDKLTTLGDSNEYDIQLSIIAYAGQAYVKNKWTAVNNSTNATFKTTVSGFGALAGDAGNTNAQAGAFMARMMFSDEGATVYNRPANYADEDTRNFVIFMTDGAPNRYYVNSTSELSSIGLSSDKLKTVDSTSSYISKAITGTDYKKMAAFKLLEQAEQFKTINNNITFSLGLGEWFVDSGETSGFETAPYLMQLVAACADGLRNPLDSAKITAQYCWDNYLGADVPDGTMQGENPCFPDMNLSAANYLQTGGTYAGKYLLKNGRNFYFDSMQDMLDSLNGVEGAPYKKSDFQIVYNGRTDDVLYDTLNDCGIPNVDPMLLSQVSYYYAGNTAEKFENSVNDITTSISKLFSSAITSVADTVDKDIDGYIKIVDNIGDGMEVRDVCGLEYDGVMYDESRFARFVTNSTTDEINALALEMLKYFNRNFGTVFTTDQLQELLHGANLGGSLYYNSSDDFAAKVLWYAKYNAQTDTFIYISPYFNSDGTLAAKPADAAYLVTQHMLSGDIDTVTTENDISKATYLYVADVENLTTNNDTLVFKIPASLIPVRTVIVTDGTAKVLGGVVWPLTLFYKVGLSVNNDVNEINEHLNVDESGNKFYVFYANCWDHSHLGVEHLGTAYSIFTPNEKNPYYHSSNNLPLYVKNGDEYVLASGNDTGPYYFDFTYSDAEGTYQEYRLVEDYYINYTINVINDALGNPYLYLSNGADKWGDELEAQRLKSENDIGNVTQTDEFYYTPYLTTDAKERVAVGSKLGNNGVYSFTPQQITNSDTVVLDYGLDVKIDVMANDIFPADATDIKLVNVASVADYKINDEQVYFVSPIPEEAKEINTADGVLSINDSSDGLIFHIKASNVNKPYTGYYGCSYVIGKTTLYTFGYVTIIPANNIYFEQNFCTFSDGWNKTGTELSFYQNGNNQYVHGYDPAYDTSIYFSNGSAIKTTVTNEMYQQALADKTYNWPSAEFTFYGTAFDIVGYTGQNTGLMAVTVTNLDTGKTVKNIAVNTHYSSRVGEDDTSSNYDDLYQIPVITYNMKTYAHYKLTIKASYHPYFDLTKKTESETATLNSGELVADTKTPNAVTANQNELSQALSEVFNDNSASIAYYTVTDGKVADVKSVENQKIDDSEYNTAATSSQTLSTITTSGKYDVYIDAIRTYNPLGTNLSDGVAAEMYSSQNELNPTYYKLRDLLIKTDEEDPGFVASSGLTGAMYVEQNVREVLDDLGNIVESVLSGGSSTIKLSTYIKNGPNSEIYLEYGNAVAFRITDYQANCHVQISTKTPTYKDAILSANGKVVDTIRSGTEMYFDVTDCVSSDGTIVLSNLGQGILSLCNIKIVSDNEITTNALVSDTLTVNALNSVMTAPVSQAPVLPENLNFHVNLVADENGKITKFAENLTISADKFKYYLDSDNKWNVYLDTTEYNDYLASVVEKNYSKEEISYNDSRSLYFEAEYDKESGEWLVNSQEMWYNIKNGNSSESPEKPDGSSFKIFKAIIEFFTKILKAMFPFIG